eukprot:s4477_g1.t1
MTYGADGPKMKRRSMAPLPALVWRGPQAAAPNPRRSAKPIRQNNGDPTEIRRSSDGVRFSVLKGLTRGSSYWVNLLKAKLLLSAQHKKRAKTQRCLGKQRLRRSQEIPGDPRSFCVFSLLKTRRPRQVYLENLRSLVEDG